MAEQVAATENDAKPGRIYKSENGLLMRKTELGKSDQVVPDSLKAFVLRRYHARRWIFTFFLQWRPLVACARLAGI